MLPTLVLIATVAHVPGIPSAAHAGRWIAIGAGAAFLLWTVRLRPTPAHWMLLGLLAWMALGALWSISPWDTAGELLMWILLAAIFAVAAETEDLSSCWVALALGVWVSVPFAVLQLLGHEPVVALGVGGLFLTTNALAQVATIAAIAMLAQRRWLLAAGPLFLIVASGSREAAVAMMAVGLVWICTWRGAPRLRTAMLLLAAMSIGTLLLMVDLLQPARLGSLSIRLSIWEFALLNLRPEGWGLGTFGALLPGFEYVHNEYLHYALELGLGSVLLLGVAIHALGARRGLERLLLVAILVQCTLSHPLHEPVTALLAALLAGFLSGARARDRLAAAGGRVWRGDGLPDLGALGIGAPVAADAGRLRLAAGPQHSGGPRALLSHAGRDR